MAFCLLPLIQGEIVIFSQLLVLYGPLTKTRSLKSGLRQMKFYAAQPEDS